MNKEKVKKFLKDNKEKIIIGGGIISITIGSLILYKLRKEGLHNTELLIEPEPFSFEKGNLAKKYGLKLPKFEGMDCFDYCKDEGNIGDLVWLSDCKVSDCGLLGENLIKIPDIKSDSEITMIITKNTKYFILK